MTFWHHFVGLEHACGSEEALRLVRASCTAVEEIGAFCEEHAIDAHYRHDGWLWTATNRSQLGTWQSTVAAVERHGERPFISLDSEEVAARAGSRAHLAGVFEPAAATVQPALLATGLRRVVRERQIAVFEYSPMITLERARPMVVNTPGGRIVADRVVIAMNAWSARLKELRRAFVVAASDIVITEPAPDELERIGWRDGVSISDSRLMVHYYRTTRDGRIAFGKGGGRLAYGARFASFNGSSPAAAPLAARLRAIYPSFERVPIAASWAGPIDRSLDGLPFFFALGRPDLVCGAGYSGNGVGPCVLGGRILASLALGLDDD
jgi:glycine/D-amino acid oxidase-like deaminating enzyme